jgi:4-aminobutyrate aminotransferase
MPDLFARHRAVIPSWVGINYSEPIEIVSGKGCRVTDAQGHSYLDFFAGILTNMLGYDVPEVREAVERQMASGIYHTSTLYLIRSQVELAEKIAKLSGIPDAKVFFTNSGSEANETALAAALIGRKANQVLAMRNSYHGRTFGTVAVTGNAAWKASSNDPFGTHYLHGTDRQLPGYRNLSDAEYIEACVADLRALLTAAISPADVGALIVEPIQGVGGFTMPPDGLLAAYKEVLDEHGILFISDEVQTGWGRTGETFWGIQAHGITPDFMTFAKGLANGFAIGGVVGRGDLLDGIRGNGISTFGGNPIATTAGNATLDYVLSHDLQKNAAACGDIIISGLKAAAGDLKTVADVRGKGLMFAVDLAHPETGRPSPQLAAKALEATRERGLLVGKGGLNGATLRMAPPLTLSEAEAREGLGLLVDALRAVDAGAASLRVVSRGVALSTVRRRLGGRRGGARRRPGQLQRGDQRGHAALREGLGNRREEHGGLVA